MKTVYLFRPDADRYGTLMRDEKDVLDVFDALREGRRLPDAQRKLVYDEGERDGDFPALDLMIPVLSERAWDALKELVTPWAKAQPVVANGRTFHALAVTHVVDCLDRENTTVDLSSYTLVARLEQIHLRTDRLDDASVFRIEGVEDTGVFLSGEFMDVVEKHKLKGLERVKVWPKG